MAKTLTTDLRHIDVRQLARQKLLVPGYRYNWEWRHPDTAERHAVIHVAVGDDYITVHYQISTPTQRCQVDQLVRLATTPCHYGRYRYWFVCPYCSKRAARLYIGFQLACRHCHRLDYKVQRESPYERACRQLDKVRERLGWQAGLFHGHGGKTKGMHRQTYWTLLAEHVRLERIILEHLAKGCGLDLASYR